MTIETEVAALTTAVNALTTTVNVKKVTLDASVSTAAASATASSSSASASATSAQTAQGQASLAQGYAASASSVVQQDLSGITAQALHRSPNAITAQFIYDTSKDSDGGAWTEKCQQTSWYNEALAGKWLGALPDEFMARAQGGTLGPNVVANPTLDQNATGFTTFNGATIVSEGGLGKLTSSSGTQYAGVWADFTDPTLLTTNVLYQMSFDVYAGTYTGTIVISSDGENPITSYASVQGGFTRYTAYISPASFGNSSNSRRLRIRFENTHTAGQYIFIDNVSYRRVTGLSASNDYFQLTTDGKFYRLWKNMLSYSGQFDNAAWGKVNLNTTGTPAWVNVQTAPDGTLTADKLIESNTTAQHYVARAQTVTSGSTCTLSFYLRAEERTWAFLEFYAGIPSGTAYINLSTGDKGATTGSASAVTVTNVGGNWWRVVLPGFVASSTTPAFAVYTSTGNGVNSYAGDGTSGIYIWGAQIEYGSAVTSYEAKAAEGTTSEIFRGNKADFPRLAAIVAEATSVNIYDLTEPGRPMWMRFISGGFIGWVTVAAITGVAAQNGYVVPVASAGMGGLLLNFPKDDVTLLWGASSYILRYRQIASRNVANVFSPEPGGIAVANSVVNAVAMTVLPDAPMDPATSLRVPTIAVATAGGVSVIKHNGSVVTMTHQNYPATSVAFLENEKIAFGADASGNSFTSYFHVNKIPSVTTDYGPYFNPSTSVEFYASRSWGGGSPTIRFADSDSYMQKAVLANQKNKVLLLSNYHSAKVHGVQRRPRSTGTGGSFTIAPTYNTGWLTGDIRRAYLSDVTAESIVGSELVTNGDFATDLTGWTVNQATSWVSGAMRIESNGGADPVAFTGLITVRPGAAYEITMTLFGSDTVARTTYIRLSTNGFAGGSIEPYAGDSGQAVSPGSTTVRKTKTLIPAGLTQVRVSASLSIGAGVSGCKMDVLDVSVREIVADRSYKAASAAINGTLTKSQLASGTSLVGYSGYSGSNYLREPYSADLDFGTGEWNASAWVNFSVGPRYNQMTYTDDLRTTEWNYPLGLTRTVSGGGTPSTGSGNYTRLTATAGNTDHYLQATGVSFVTGVNYTLSFEVQYVDHRWVGLAWFDNGYRTGSTFDLLNGVVGSNLGTNFASSITPLGGGRYRISISRTALQTGAVYAAVVMLDSDKSFVSSTTSNLSATTVDIGLVDLRVSTAPSGYQRVVDGTETFSGIIAERAFSSGPKLTLSVVNYGNLQAIAFDGTTTRTVTTTAAYNIATWLKAEANYTTDGSLTIRVNGREVAATRGNPLLTLNSRYNLLTFTEQFDNAAWGKVAISVSANTTVSPNGTQTADTITCQSGSNNHYFPQTLSSSLIATTHTYTLRVKYENHQWFLLQLYDSTNSAYACFDLLNKVVGLKTVGVTSSIVQVAGTDFYTLTLTSSVLAGSGYVYGHFVTSDRITAQVWTATGTEAITVWGADLRLSALSALPYQRVGAATDFDFQAPLTIGNNYTLDGPFPGTIALLKLGATVPTPEQSQFMYEQEKQLFRANAQSVMPDTGSIVDMAYDDATDRWVAVSAANESYWTGLIRNTVTPVPAGSYTKIVATSGIELAARSTTNPGVDVTIPAYGLREELVKRAEAAARLGKELSIFDYVGGFTANTTNGNTAITSASPITYPASYIGARISGSGIPANTTIVAVSGTTLYLSAAATATATTVSITFLDFALPAGMEAKVVFNNGAQTREGTTGATFSRLYDGFVETIRFAAAPGATNIVNIQAQRTS